MISALTVSVAAQEGSSAIGIQFGFAQTDYRLNSWDPEADGKELNTTALNGFKAGLVWDATFVKGFGSMVGLNYTFGTYNSAWRKEKDNQIAEYPQIKEKDFYHQLELFVDWQYKFQIASDTYIILYTGPTLQCQLSLTERSYKRYLSGDVELPQINHFDYDDASMHTDYKRINVTWGVGAGFQYDRYYLRGGYDFGLINPFKISDFNEVFGNVYGDNHDTGRATRGRLDQWSIKLGIFFWQSDK